MNVREGEPLLGRVHRLPPEYGPGDSRHEKLEGGLESPRVYPSREWVVKGNKRAGEVSPGNHRPAGTLFDSLRRVVEAHMVL